MKLGLIVEGLPSGPDEQVYKALVKLLCPKVEVEVKTLGDKRTLFEEAPKVAKTLLDTGYDFVAVIWDRMPRWGKPGRCPEDSQSVQTSLLAEGLSPTQFSIHCIEMMLESWLVADGRGVTNWLRSKTTQPVSNFNGDINAPKPKVVIQKWIEQTWNSWTYNDTNDNIHIFKALAAEDSTLSRAAKANPSFAALKGQIEALCA